VREVLRPQEIHPLPKAPEFIEGIINLRGRIISVIDLRKKLNIRDIEDRPRMRIIICKIKGFIVGLIVDCVSEVVSLSKEDVQPTPAVVSMYNETAFISGIARVGERVITLLNLEEVLTKEEVAELSKVKK
jgi:purine-binding chemotaxis protein CheW